MNKILYLIENIKYANQHDDENCSLFVYKFNPYPSHFSFYIALATASLFILIYFQVGEFSIVTNRILHFITYSLKWVEILSVLVMDIHKIPKIKNIPLTSFPLPTNNEKMRQPLSSVVSELPRSDLCKKCYLLWNFNGFSAMLLIMKNFVRIKIIGWKPFENKNNYSPSCPEK